MAALISMLGHGHSMLCTSRWLPCAPTLPAQLLIRVLRKTEGQRRVPQEDIDGCFSAVNHAVSHFPDSAEVVMAMAIIQAYGQEDVHSAQSSVQKARGMSVSMVRAGSTRQGLWQAG